MAPEGPIRGAVLRSEVPREQRWNAESVFATPEEWDLAFAATRAELSRFGVFQGSLAAGEERLADCFEALFALRARIGELSVYAGMAYNTDAHDVEAQVRYERIRSLAAEGQAITAFLEPELLAIGMGVLRNWVETSDRLARYGHFLDRLERKAANTRSIEVERLLGDLSAPFAGAGAAHGALANTDLAFAPAEDASGTPFEVGQGTIRSLLSSPDRTLRRNAYHSYTEAHLRFRTTFAALMGTGVRQKNLLARTRGYDSALHAALAPDAIPLSVFHTLLEAFRSNLPVWHRYWRARKAILGLEILEPFDLSAPLAASPPRIPFEQAVAWLADALAPLGEAYVRTMRRGALEERWVDRAPNRGKRMGAFSSGVQGTHPFIMMSYTEDVFGMSTLAHELGHSMHSYLAWQAQPPVYADYSLFVAEVASNFHQAMLRAHLFERFAGHRDLEIALIEEAMANFYRYFLVMPTLARFELELHERETRGHALSGEFLSGLMADLFAEAYGDGILADRDRLGITWAQFHTHLYRPYYAYQYATGIAGANALTRGILEGGMGAAEGYLAFLAAGGSGDPLPVLRKAGVDLTSPEPVERAFAVLEGLVARLESLTA